MSTATVIEGTAVPEPVTRLADVMASYPRPWALCGGWALDAWLGRLSRDHGDVDLSVFEADHQQLFDHLAGWQLIAHTSVVDDDSTKPWDGRRLPVPSHIHARAPEDAAELPKDGICNPSEGWWLDIQIDGRAGDEWVLVDEPRLTMPMRDAIRTSPWGVPATSPELLLFFKAGAGNAAYPRRRDWRDFVAFLPRLSDAQAAWLREAINRVDPGNPWVEPLSWVTAIRESGAPDR